MKEFSLREYLEHPGRKVATRCGYEARIICTDNRGARGNSEYPVIALVKESVFSNTESIYEYDRDGRVFRVFGSDKHNLDLVFDDGTGFPEAKRRISWVNILADGGIRYPSNLFETREAAEKSARRSAESGTRTIATVRVEWAETRGTGNGAIRDNQDNQDKQSGVSAATPFTIAGYLKDPSRKVVTRAGLPVRIICTDRSAPEKPVIALVNRATGSPGDPLTYPEAERLMMYHEDGAAKDYGEESDYDLFFVRSKRTGWMNLYRPGDSWVYTGNRIFATREEAEERAAESDATGLPECCATVKLEWEE